MMEGIETKQLGVVDWILFAALLVISLGIGVYSALRGKGNNSTQEYLVGGKTMSPLPVAISLLGSVISAISIIGLATEMYFFGTQYVISLLGWIYGNFTVQLLILPILYPLGIVSANEYITMRFKSERLMKIASICNILKSFMIMGLFLYAPSLTLSTVTSISTYTSITIMGLVCTFYITIGGVKAVVYTDVVQTLLMLFGVLVVVIVCLIDLGGFGTVYKLNNEGGRLEFFNMDTDPLVRHTFWSVQVQGFYLMLAWVGFNQSTFQRFISVSTLDTSKRLSTFFLAGIHVLWLTFFLSGIVAYAVYKNCDPLASGRIEKPDQIMPYLVLDKLSHLTGMAGLFVAAVYGGVLSSLSSTGNSTACLIWEDILKHMKIFKGISETKATTVVKILSAVSGLIGMAVGFLVSQLGSILQVANSIGNAFSGAITGIFISGMCTPWINLKGAYVGFISALLFNMWIVVGQFVVGMGHPEKLPLSTEGCPENLNVSLGAARSVLGEAISEVSIRPTVISSVYGSSTESLDIDESSPSLAPEFATNPEGTNRDIYHISYCYTGMLGIIIHIVVSTIISIITGPTPPEDVEPRLTSPRCLRFYRRIWKMMKPSKTARYDLASDNESIAKEVAIPMITKKKTDHIDTPE